MNPTVSEIPEMLPADYPAVCLTQAGGIPLIRVNDTLPESKPIIPSKPADTSDHAEYQNFQGPEYSLTYPLGWKTNVSTLPLREFHHTWNGCSVTLAWQLDQEIRMYYSKNNASLFYSSIVTSQRDIWPRDLNGQIDYADVLNSILGNPDYCANTPMGAFTIAGVSDVLIPGISNRAVRVDFGKVNATGFTEGTGTAYIITGKNHSGVFTFYTVSEGSSIRYSLPEYMFNSLRMDPGF